MYVMSLVDDPMTRYYRGGIYPVIGKAGNGSIQIISPEWSTEYGCNPDHFTVLDTKGVLDGLRIITQLAKQRRMWNKRVSG